MENFWDYSVWGFFSILAVLLGSLLLANVLRKSIKLLRDSLIPTSVLGGGILVLVGAVYKWLTGDVMYDTAFFGGNGTATLELLTYHCLALGFIASTFKPSQGKITKKPATATEAELAENPRSRSAKLRCIEKLHDRYE